jgi:hypothetical protein
MENKPEAPSAPVEGATPAQMSFAQRVGSVWFEPTKTFEDINRKPTWLGIFIILSILGMAMSYTLNARVDRETRIRKSMEMVPILSEEQKQQALQRALAQPASPFETYGFVAVPVVVLVTNFVLAAIFLLAFMLRGVSLPYKKSLSISYWAMAPPSIVVQLLAILFMLVRDPDTLELNPLKNVASNLGILVSEKAHPVVNSLLGSIDIFSIWTIVLLSIGFAAVSDRKLTAKKSATIVVLLWVVLILVKAGWSALF